MIEYETELPDGAPVTVLMRLVCAGDPGTRHQPASEAEFSYALTDKHGNAVPEGEMTKAMLENAEQRWSDDCECRRDMAAEARYDAAREEGCT